MVVFAGVVWSLQGFTIRMFEHASSEQIVFWRAVSQFFVILALVAIINRGRVIRAFRRAGPAAFVGGICHLVASTAFIFALGHTTVANVTFFLAASPLFAAVIAFVVMRERIAARTLAAMLVALLGIGVMGSEGVFGGDLAGQIYSFVTMLGFAGMAVVARWGGGLHMLPMTLWGAMFTVVAGFALSGGVVGVPLEEVGVAFISGGVLTSAGAALFLMGGRYVPAGVLAFLTLTETVLAPIWVWLGFGEVPSGYTFAGGAIVFAALVGEATLRVTRGRREGPPAPAPAASTARLGSERSRLLVPVANIVVGSILLALALALIVAGRG